MYNPGDNSWASKADYPYYALYATTFQLCNQAFVTGDNNSSRVYRYTPSDVISGPSIVCSSETYSLPGGSASWSSDNTGILTINSSGVASRVGNASGQVTISASQCSMPLPLTKTIWVGNPIVNVESSDYYEVCATSWLTLSYTPITQNQGVGSQYWSCTNCQVVSDPYATTVTVQAPGSGYFTVSLDISNGCGTSSTGRSFIAVDEIGGQPCQLYSSVNGGMDFSISPNPASDMLTIEASTSNSTTTKKQLLKVKLINENQELILSESSQGNKLTIETKHVKAGLYYLQVEQGDESVTKRVLIKH